MKSLLATALLALAAATTTAANPLAPNVESSEVMTHNPQMFVTKRHEPGYSYCELSIADATLQSIVTFRQNKNGMVVEYMDNGETGDELRYAERIAMWVEGAALDGTKPIIYLDDLKHVKSNIVREDVTEHMDVMDTLFAEMRRASLLGKYYFVDGYVFALTGFSAVLGTYERCLDEI